jgi:molybdate transport system substrate-binding protein
MRAAGLLIASGTIFTPMKTCLTILVLFVATVCGFAELTVFSASSTTDVMKELAALYEAEGGEPIRFNIAASGALARQIDAGAPADLYVSANTKWMDFLEKNGRLEPDTRMDLVGNSLVLIAPKESKMTWVGFPQNLSEYLAVGDFRSVPAGAYAKAALSFLDWMDAVKERLIQGSNVRTVLLYVERGEVDAGIVYLTDARQSSRVKVLGTFPTDSHAPILYPAACISGCHSAARDFLGFLAGPQAETVWERYGFIRTLP